jgi:hypothetical protein
MLAQFPRPAHVERDVRTTAMVFWRSAAQAAEWPFDTAATILDYRLKMHAAWPKFVAGRG